MPAVQAAGADAGQGAPAASAPAAVAQPAANPKPPAKKQAPWFLLAAGGAVAVIVAALLVGRAILAPTARPAATPLAAQAPAVPNSPSPAEPVTPATLQGAGSPNAEASQADLENAIAAGSVERLRALLADLSAPGRAAIAASPNGARLLDLARRSVEADAALGKAMKAKNWVAAVQQASALVALLPAGREAQQARETAAVALEAQAEALLRQGQSDAALAKLQALQRAWPNRAGLEARLAGIHSAREAEARFVAALAAADAAEKERRPEKGLEALAQVVPDARFRERFAAARQRLDSLLAQLDTAPPVVRLKPGSKTSYSKGKPFTLSVIVTDDYRVKSVTVMARQEGAPAYQELPVHGTGPDEYTVEITPAFHDNKTVELYVVATDFAGHSSQLGTAEQPLHIKKRWLFF